MVEVHVLIHTIGKKREQKATVRRYPRLRCRKNKGGGLAIPNRPPFLILNQRWAAALFGIPSIGHSSVPTVSRVSASTISRAPSGSFTHLL